MTGHFNCQCSGGCSKWKTVQRGDSIVDVSDNMWENNGVVGGLRGGGR